MTHFDFKCLLPALLQVEDRMSMAHGLESRVPLLDHPLVEFAATIPADIKFKGGQMKHLLKLAYGDELAEGDHAAPRQDGFPGAAQGMVLGRAAAIWSRTCSAARGPGSGRSSTPRRCWPISTRPSRFSRKIWGLLSLEMWHQMFHDRAAEYRRMVDMPNRRGSIAAQ